MQQGQQAAFANVMDVFLGRLAKIISENQLMPAISPIDEKSGYVYCMNQDFRTIASIYFEFTPKELTVNVFNIDESPASVSYGTVMQLDSVLFTSYKVITQFFEALKKWLNPAEVGLRIVELERNGNSTAQPELHDVQVSGTYARAQPEV